MPFVVVVVHALLFIITYISMYLSVTSFTLPQSFTLSVTTPDLALLVLKVMDSDVNADDFIAQVLLLLILLLID